MAKNSDGDALFERSAQRGIERAPERVPERAAEIATQVAPSGSATQVAPGVPVADLSKRDERIHMQHHSDSNTCACGRDSRGRITVRVFGQLDQVTCKQCSEKVAADANSYEASSVKYANARKKVIDRNALRALSDEDEAKEFMG